MTCVLLFVLQLRELGVDANDVTWSRTTMTSDCHICIRKRQNSGHTKDDEVNYISFTTVCILVSCTLTLEALNFFCTNHGD